VEEERKISAERFCCPTSKRADSVFNIAFAKTGESNVKTQ
jgi:hypothetical protein